MLLLEILLIVIGGPVLVGFAIGGSASWSSRLCRAYVLAIASVATLTTLAGLTHIEIEGVSARCLYGAGILLAVVVARISSDATEIVTSSASSRPTRVVWFLPVGFLIIAGRAITADPATGWQWLIRQWDATSNPGAMATTRVSPSLDVLPVQITGWEGYPRATHSFLGAGANLFGIDQVDFPISTLKIFYAGHWVVYFLLLIMVGQVAGRLSLRLGGDRQISRLATITAQGLLLTPFMIHNLLMMHSLAFVSALLAVEVVTDELVTFEQSGAVWSRSSIIVLTAALFVVITSYPMLLLLPVCAWCLGILLRQVHLDRRHPVADLCTLLWSLSSVSIALVSLIAFQDQTNTTELSKSGGHLIPLPLSWLIVGVISLGLFAYQIRGQLSRVSRLTSIAVILTSIAPVAALWFLAGSFDREYGVNYYPKKSEYGMAVSLIPVVAAALVMIGYRIVRTTRLARGIAPAMLVVLVALQFVAGPMRTLDPANENKTIARLISQAIDEAKIEGRSILFDPDDVSSSAVASLLSNYVDKSMWLEPNGQRTNTVIFQSMQSISTFEELSTSCNFLNTDSFRGRIVDVSTGQVVEC